MDRGAWLATVNIKFRDYLFEQASINLAIIQMYIENLNVVHSHNSKKRKGKIIFLAFRKSKNMVLNYRFFMY